MVPVLLRVPAWIWVLLSGLLLGLNAPGRHTQLVGMVSLFPFLLALEQIHARHGSSWKRRLLLTLLASWGVGYVAAPIGVNWMTHCLRIFGHLPWLPSYLITSAGYGLEVGYLLFFCFGLRCFSSGAGPVGPPSAPGLLPDDGAPSAPDLPVEFPGDDL